MKSGSSFKKLILRVSQREVSYRTYIEMKNYYYALIALPKTLAKIAIRNHAASARGRKCV